jgi:Polysaccharide biosynthesis protein
MSGGAVLFGLCLAIAPVLVVFYHEPHLFCVTATLASGFVFGAGAAQHGAVLLRQMRFFALAVVDILSLSASVERYEGAAVNDADPIAGDVCLEHCVCRLWIQAERRLIQKEDFRFIEQCADDIDPLLHSR